MAHQHHSQQNQVHNRRPAAQDGVHDITQRHTRAARALAQQIAHYLGDEHRGEERQHWQPTSKHGASMVVVAWEDPRWM